jgi:protein tyrosine/serine phosphatase
MMPLPDDGRALIWEGCVNIRDLGGLPTSDGGTTRLGAVVRADSVRQLSDVGWAALVGYGIGRIVDLRWQSELAADPPRELPVETVHIPLFPEPDSDHWLEIVALDEAAPDAETAKGAGYIECLERFSSSFVTAVGTIVETPKGGALVHCMGGKDRTGLVSALLLRLADVSVEDIAEDYALSGENLRAATEEWIESAANDDERRRRERMAVTPASAMATVLTELETRHGGAREYLLNAGAAEEMVEQAQALLR